MLKSSDRLALQLALALPVLLLGGAYISQYGFGLYPCEMCWWQRYPHIAAIALALLAAFTPARRMLIALAGLAIFASGVIGVHHAGVEYGWWEGFTGCAVPAGSGGNALDSILNAPIIRCDQAPWTLWNISLAGWNALFSIGGALAIWLLLLAKEKRA